MNLDKFSEDITVFRGLFLKFRKKAAAALRLDASVQAYHQGQSVLECCQVLRSLYNG